MTQKREPRESSVSEIATIDEGVAGEVTLRLKKERFSEFLFEFLGPKETLSKNFKGVFVISKNDLLQFHYLLTQKIEKEQFISLTLESATIQYDDNTSRTINTFPAIENYSEFRNVAATSFQLTWKFVFQTPKDKTLQQQIVSVYFEPGADVPGVGTLTVKIEHSNQVWATEVLRMFEEHISKIATKNTIFFQSLNFLKRFRIFGTLTVVLIAIGGGLGIYLWSERQKLVHPLTVKEEFIFDMANVLKSSDNDLDTTLQFFLINDLRHESTSIIQSLHEAGRFNPRYKGIIDKLLEGYYDTGKESTRIVSFSTLREEIKAVANMRWAFWYLTFVIIYVLTYMLAAIFLRVFRLKSIIAITDKGIKEADQQQRTKSASVQFAFGVLSSLLASVIYAACQSLVFSS